MGKTLFTEPKLKTQNFSLESNLLRQAWMQYDSKVLNEYLVNDVEDPRINPQSILSRCFLIEKIFPEEFTLLIHREFQFSICLTFILKALKNKKVSRESILYTLENDKKTFSGIRLPPYLRQCFGLLSNEKEYLPDYITDALIAPVSDTNIWLPDSALSTFEQIWYSVLSQREGNTISVMEPACGSANDYRYLDSFGVSKYLEYMGFDICEKNIENAKRRFPDVSFEVGNILDIHIKDNSHDYLFVHDLFEHLSVEAIEVGLAKICKVTRKQAFLSFFNMADISEHIIRPVRFYHWNTLSLRKIQKFLKNLANSIDVVHIDTFLKKNYCCTDYHNKKAYTLVLSF